MSDQALTKNQYFVLRYIIDNTKSNSIDMVVSLNITTSVDPVNFNVSYIYSTNSTDLSTDLTSNRSNFSSTFAARELRIGSIAYIYVLCEIVNLEIDASFVGTANWELVDKNEFEGEYVAPAATLITGQEFAKALKVPGNSSATYSTSDSTVKSITFDYYGAEYNDVVNNASVVTDIATSDSVGDALMYHVSNSSGGYDVYVLSEGKILANITSSYMFYNCFGLGTLDVSNFDTSSVTDMDSMFSECTGLSELDVSNFNTSSVTGMSNMFSHCIGLGELDLSNFNTSSVTNMSYMFQSCSGLTAIYIGSGWSTAKVTSGTFMFNRCTSLPNYYNKYTDYTYYTRYMTLKS